MPENRVISARKVFIFKYAQYERQKELIITDFSNNLYCRKRQADFEIKILSCRLPNIAAE
jgi:hypothetical protein